jgi:hypothetical protein
VATVQRSASSTVGKRERTAGAPERLLWSPHAEMLVTGLSPGDTSCIKMLEPEHWQNGRCRALGEMLYIYSEFPPGTDTADKPWCTAARSNPTPYRSEQTKEA